MQPKTITRSQLLGEIGETAVKGRFLRLGFQFDGRGRLEAGIDGIAEVMVNGRPTGKMLAVQVKSRDNRPYSGEDDHGFHYLVDAKDLEYWRPSNLPVILVLYREEDESFYWKHIEPNRLTSDRKVKFDKVNDRLDQESVERLAQLTVKKSDFGHYVPPLRGGEVAILNLLPVSFPSEIFVASTHLTAKEATRRLYNVVEAPTIGWVINDRTLWSFENPSECELGEVVDADQVEAIDTSLLAENPETTHRNQFSFLLKQTLRQQYREELCWDKERKLLYFSAHGEFRERIFKYKSFKNYTESSVVSAFEKEGSKPFMRHHAFVPRFECFSDTWHLIVSPTYYFTRDGTQTFPFAETLLSGKKRLDNNAALRGQTLLWSRFLDQGTIEKSDSLFEERPCFRPTLTFGDLPEVLLSMRVPEETWGPGKVPSEDPKDGFFSE